VLMGLSFALAVYTHYFAGLFCVILWLGGWIFVSRGLRMPYLLAALMASLLFIPHLGITMHQLGVGGIPDVLNKPGARFLLHHFSYLVNFSWVIGVPALVLALVALTTKVWQDKRAAFAFYLWLTPMLIGWIYSELYSPVLQDRVLLFSLPFMGVFLGSALPSNLGQNKRKSVIFILVFLGVYLVSDPGIGRYRLMRKGEFEGVLKDAINNNDEGSKHLISMKEEILDYYKRKMPLAPLNFVMPDSLWTLSDFDQSIAMQYPRPLSYAWTTQTYIPPPEVNAILRSYYGAPSARVNYPAGEYFQYGGEGTCIDPYREISVLGNGEGWKVNLAGKASEWSFPSDKTWGLAYERPLMEVADHSNDRLYFSIEGNWSKGSTFQMVVELLDEDESVYWKSISLGEWSCQDTLDCKAHLCLPLYSVDLDLEDLTFRAYLWNKGHESLKLKSARIWSDGGNYLIYGIDHPWVEVDAQTHLSND